MSDIATVLTTTIRLRPTPAATTITGATVMTPSGLVPDTTVTIEDGLIATVGGAVRGQTVAGEGLLLLPGIIDLHGDAFERALSPRPGTILPVPLALAENDAWLLAAGITTSFCSITDSYEPGLRSRATSRQLIEHLHGSDALPLACDTRVHLRHEVCLTEGHEELMSWLDKGWVDLLSTADHLPNQDDARKQQRYRNALSRRLAMDDQAVNRLIAETSAQRELGRRQEREMAEQALLLGIPLASHDDDSHEAVLTSLGRGVAICEFPATAAIARLARSGGATVLMGAPNWVRGGSHLGLLSVAEAIDAGVVDALCSDYHYPSLFHAPFLLDRRQVMSLPCAWDLVSLRPARAAGMRSKGRIAPGYAADLLLVDGWTHDLPCLASVFVAGREVARYS